MAKKTNKITSTVKNWIEVGRNLLTEKINTWNKSIEITLSTRREQNLRLLSTRRTGHLTFGATKYRIHSYASSRDTISTVSRTDGRHLKPL
jgi:hypothetical protein